MVTKGIVFAHVISSDGIEVDKLKIDLIANLPLPPCVKKVWSLLGHAKFCHRFIQDFNKIINPLSNLLAKDVPFHFPKECLEAFTKLNEALTTAYILHPPIWGEPFELMCDTSNYTIRVVIGQHIDKKLYVIYYVSHTLNDAQINYIVTEKHFFVVVFAFEKFRPYLIGSHVIVFTDNGALKHLLSKRDAKPKLVRWMLLLQKFDCEIRDKKGSDNPIVDHLSRIVCIKGTEDAISKCFPDEQLFIV